MSNLIKPYTIAVYIDELKDGIFSEKRVCIIGSDTMNTPGRALEPQLARNVNG
jgi:hypothetical protein